MKLPFGLAKKVALRFILNMTTLLKATSIFTALVLLVFTATAQEGTRETQYNAAQYYHKQKANNLPPQLRATLPFIDDFSTTQVTPDPNKWIDTDVYINATCPINPPSIGVATLDGLAGNGVPYNPNGGSGTAQDADKLTSQFIDLSAFTPDQNVYLSFMYEPKGRCNAPEGNDSLVLEFRIDSLTWSSQWSTGGGLDTTAYSRFKSVIIRIDNPIFFTDTFAFRFRNKATITGNADHWHIDYVQLDANRNDADTVLNDIAIQYPAPSLLKTYREMPWQHFKANPGGETATQAKIFARNNFTTDKNTTYGYTAIEEYSTTGLPNPPVAAFNFPALSNAIIDNLPAVDLNPIAGNDSASILTTYFASLAGSPDELPSNDTITHHQRFGDYFAYDDGTSESAYYVSGLGAQAALRYHLNFEDTIQGVRVHWTRVDGPQTNLLFSIKVWKSIIPEVLLYQQDFLNAEYVDSTNGFATHLFTTPVVTSDTFYVGLSLSQTGDGPDIGFDRNTDASSQFWFNTGLGWTHSLEKGAAMIRPIVGGDEGLINTGLVERNATASWQSFPNPVNSWVKISNAPDGSRYQLINMLGQTVSNGDVVNERVDLPNVPNGTYLLKVTSEAISKTFRLVKQ